MGLGWGWGGAFGSNYIQIDPDFESSSKDKRPSWLKGLQETVSVLKFQKHQEQGKLSEM